MVDMKEWMGRSEEKIKEIERDIATFDVNTNPPWRKETDKYYKLELTVDSGAHESVTPPNTIPGMVPAKGKHQEPYYAANGTKIENYGAIGIRGLTSEKTPFRLRYLHAWGQTQDYRMTSCGLAE